MMIGRSHKGAIMTTNDMCTHLVLIRGFAGKEATPLTTITADNGKEFARHKEIAKGLDPNSAPHISTTLRSGAQTKTQTG